LLGQRGVVGGDDDGGADPIEVVKEFDQDGGRFDVEVGRRLVGQDGAWPIDHGAGNRQPLLFAAREGDRQGILAIEQTHFVERRLGAPDGVLARNAGNVERQEHVGNGAAVKEQLLVLKDQADVASDPGQGVVAQGGEVLAVDQQAAGAWPFDRAKQLEQGRFAGAGAAGHQHHLAGLDVEAGIDQRAFAAGVVLGKGAGRNQRH